MTSKEIIDRIGALEAKLAPTLKELNQFRTDLVVALSKEFIAANRITRADVELSDLGKGEYFGTAWNFGDWLRANSTKRWAEWNGLVYHASDIINHRLRETPARMEHVP